MDVSLNTCQSRVTFISVPPQTMISPISEGRNITFVTSVHLEQQSIREARTDHAYQSLWRANLLCRSNMTWMNKVPLNLRMRRLTAHLIPDQMWLDTYNEERKREHLDRVSYEVFEIVMDRLEKEWFNLVS